MAFNKLKTRKGKLKEQLELELTKANPDINNILEIIDIYEKNNLDTIKKLKREKHLDVRRINGALKQTINAHGPITKELIGSASKRIYGTLLGRYKESLIRKFLNLFK